MTVRNWAELDQEGRSRHRFDFSFTVLSSDDAARTITVSLEPDPRRYFVTTEGDNRLYVDRFLSIAIPEEVVQEMMKSHLTGLPISYAPPEIGSSSTYAISRREALEREAGGADYIPPSEKAHPQKELFEESEVDFVSFISVDLVGSSRLRNEYGEKFDLAYSIFLRELMTTVGQFRGSVLNVTGDGFIAYIDLPGFTTQCDNTIDLGLTFLKLLRESINPVLALQGLPAFKIRIGADVGKAVKRPIQIKATNFESFDIGSAALNRAVKIENEAQSDQFLIGQNLYELIHVGWLERCVLAVVDGESIGSPGYEIYEVS